MASLQNGLLAPDPGALSPEQLEQLRSFKIQTRIANEKYLRAHKEVELLISGFFRLKLQPGGAMFGSPLLTQYVPSRYIFGDPPRNSTKGSFLSFLFYREMFLKRPDNIQEFAADYFTDPRLPDKIHMQLIKEQKAA